MKNFIPCRWVEIFVFLLLDQPSFLDGISFSILPHGGIVIAMHELSQATWDDDDITGGMEGRPQRGLDETKARQHKAAQGSTREHKATPWAANAMLCDAMPCNANDALREESRRCFGRLLY